MNNQEDQIKDYFSAKLRNWSTEPPKGAWEAVQAAQRRRQTMFIFRVSAIAATLLLLLSLPFMMIRKTSDHYAEQPSTASISVPAPEEKLLGSNPPNNTNQPAQNSFEATQKPEQSIVMALKTSAILLENLTDNAHEADNYLMNNDLTSQNEEQANNQLTEEEIQNALVSMLADLKQPESGPENERQNKERLRPSVALAYNVTPAALTGENGLFANILNYRFGPDPFQGNMAYETRNFKDVQESRLEAPFSAGLRFSLAASQRLAFETGLSFTRLNTFTKTFPLDGVHFEYNQMLIYIGIPLGMRYDLLQTRLINFYISQNVMAEKGVAAINTINKFEKERTIGKMKLYDVVQGFQLSTTTSAGLGLNLHKYISFYAEGGLQIFYLNHTQPFNIRSSKNLWPVYQSGIRVNL
jgi:hypothetical protein